MASLTPPQLPEERNGYGRGAASAFTHRSSRYVRPALLPPFAFAERDLKVLLAVYRHRFLSAAHLKTLVFPGVSLKRVQRRLRKLWAHQYLERHYLAGPPNRALLPERAGQPLYQLARRGAEQVAAAINEPLRRIPHTRRANARGFATLLHHLVATDFLVALEGACRAESRVTLSTTLSEHTLRERHSRARQERRPLGVLLPDGAFSLVYPPGQRPLTFYLEVIRADVRGGNRTFVKRLSQYVATNRAGVFQAVYGHELIRAVLILTTSERRAELFRSLAAALPTSRALFWFGAFLRNGEQGRLVSTLTPETILTRPWQTADGPPVSLLTLVPPAPAAPYL